MNQIKAIIFDMDGVLLDSESICDKTWEIAGKEFNLINPDPIEGITACRGMNKHDTKIILKQLYGKDFDSDKYLARTSELFREIENKSGVPTLPYAKEALEILGKKYRLALASSTRAETVERQLKAGGLYDFFETRICGDMVVHSKPEPEIYLKSIESLGLTPSDCVAVEDSPNGIKSAVAAGLKTIMIPDRIAPNEETEKLCWKTFQSLKELCDFLELL